MNPKPGMFVMSNKQLNSTPFSMFREVFSSIFFKEDQGKKYQYSTWKVLFKGVLGGMFSLVSLREHIALNEKVKISVSQFCQRTRIISLSLLRIALFMYFKRLKRRDNFRKCILIFDKTFFSLPSWIPFGKWCHVKQKGKETKEWGVEFSFILAYFPEAAQSFLLDWEFVPKGTGEERASKIAMDRVVRKMISHRVKVHLIIADRLYCNHYWYGNWSREIAEGFLTIPKKNMLVRADGKGLLDGIKFLDNPGFYRGRINHKNKVFDLYEIDNLFWPGNNDHRKYMTSEEKTGRTLRLIIGINIENGCRWYSLTNATHIVSAREVFKSYSMRWKIEEFYQLAKGHFGELPLSKNLETFTIRLILKLLGVCLFFLTLRYLRRKIDSNIGDSIKNLGLQLLFELKSGFRLYNAGRRKNKKPLFY